MADTMGDEAFCATIAREIVARTRPEQAIPGTYAHYHSLVHDGIEFFLSQVNRQRIIDLVYSQLTLDAETCCQERLLALAQRFPTLHKLGQLIARHPDIDPAVRQWLIALENGHYGTPPDELLVRIDAELERTGKKADVQVASTILSEASVGAVIPFQWRSSPDAGSQHGVFKVLRPGIRGRLEEELAILERTAVFFHDHRTRYPLKDLRFLEIFDDLRELMVHEVDLVAEQRYLEAAGRFYADMPTIRIPRCLSLSSSNMTAMEFLDGDKLTDAKLTEMQRKQMAETLFTALVLKPLFSSNDRALFHGDPHAGNILAVCTSKSTDPAIGLVDWSLAGFLARGDRIKTMSLIQGLLKKDLTGMCDAIISLTQGASHSTHMPRKELRDLILGWLHESEHMRLPLVKQVFRLLEALSKEGMMFPADLMLFRKAIFALEGVLHDLWPAFDMNAAIAQHMMSLIHQEFPVRLGNLLFPLSDRPENYRSLISNQDLHTLIAHQYIDTLFSFSQRLMAPFVRRGQAAGVF
jgi:ubiquinone biosynthesis protein